MTDTTQAGQAENSLWDDEAMHAAYKGAFEKDPDVHHWALLCWIRDDMAQALTAAQERVKELESQLADRPWKRIEGNVPAEVSQSYYVPEAGDDASNSYSVLLSSNGIAFDSYHSLNIEGMFEIVQIVYEGDDTP